MDIEMEFDEAGLDAIAAVMQQLYPGQQGLFFDAEQPPSLGGDDPLEGVEVWKSERGTPHWHYVTYGLTELYEKESDDPEESGFGFELTFRLRRGDESEPPSWPISLLNNLADYVFSTGRCFGPGHHMNANGPIALGTDTRLTALGFRLDPELEEQHTPNGRFVFLQVVGLTRDEMDAMMLWDGQKFLEEMSGRLPLCVTDLSRACLLEDPGFYAAWQAGVARDGSSTAFFFMDQLGFRQENGRAVLRLGAGRWQTTVQILRARVGKGRPLLLRSNEQSVLFRPGENAAVGREEDTPALTLSAQALEELCTLPSPHAGSYPLTSMPLTVELVPTRITDKQGNVVQVIE